MSELVINLQNGDELVERLRQFNVRVKDLDDKCISASNGLTEFVAQNLASSPQCKAAVDAIHEYAVEMDEGTEKIYKNIARTLENTRNTERTLEAAGEAIFD